VSDRRLRVMLLRTRYPHWSRHAVLTQTASALGEFADVTERLVTDGDDDFPIRAPVVRRALSAITRLGGVQYYRLSDLAAEGVALRRIVQGRVDILHYLDGEHGALSIPALRPLVRARGARTVATYHQPPELLDNLVPRRVVARLDMVHVVAPNQLEWFERTVGSDRVRCILHPANVEFFRPPAHRPSGGVLRCITVGHWLRDFEAIRRVARILAVHQDIRFDLVTSRETGCELLSNVTHHRNVSDDRLLELYQRAGLLFLPVRSATANNALLEGIACGLPVVSSDISAMRAYLEGTNALLVAGNDPSELAAAIVRLRGDAELRTTMGLRSRERAESLAWPQIAPEYIRAYQDVLA
jgi:glycosyltransferase involved in cell wall biosynthesis